MNNNPYNPLDWKYLIPNIEDVLHLIDRNNILSVGVAPYVRIVPSFFLKNYSIFSVKRSSDVDVLKTYLPSMYVLEDKDPVLANKVHGTNYLVRNFSFQKFYQSLRPQPFLMFNTISDDLVSTLTSLRMKVLGNHPESFNDVKYKSDFRKLLQKYNLNPPVAETYSWDNFQMMSEEELTQKFGGSFVVQRGDKEVGNNEGTFFIHHPEDLKRCIEILKSGPAFNSIIVTQYLKGNSTSMLGCVMEKGILSGPLQLQLIDIPECLQGLSPYGNFFGNDQGFKKWGDHIEKKAQKVVEGIGNHLRNSGYRGIFGIDFIYDENRDDIFAIECNPRSPGSLLLYSCTLLEAKVPPLDFFHIVSQLGIDMEIDFERINQALKIHSDYSHISFSPKNIDVMRLPIVAGVYNFDMENNILSYKGHGMSLADLKDKNDFLLIDTVPQLGQKIEKTVPRLFKLIFPYSIGLSSYQIEKRAAFLIDRFAGALIRADKEFNNQ